MEETELSKKLLDFMLLLPLVAGFIGIFSPRQGFIVMFASALVVFVWKIWVS